MRHRPRTRHFNPRTPVGCDTVAPFSTICATISIHAPQWGATLIGSDLTKSVRYFNPRTPVGCDGQLKDGYRPTVISIHAPQWGATSPYSRTANSPTDFNPRTPVGCDRHTAITPPARSLFQSTHPSGVRPGGTFDRAMTGSIPIHAPQWGATAS